MGISMTTDSVFIPLPELHALSVRILHLFGLSLTHAEAVARVIVAGQRDASQSHGVYRLLNCVSSLQADMVEKVAEPHVEVRGGAVVHVDAKRGFSPLAFERGKGPLVAAARTHGIAALVIRHSFHFSALWPEVEALTADGIVALAMCPSHAWVAPYGGTRPLFGTNPIAFGWPRAGGTPYVFDFATSAIARGDLELHQRAGKALPEGSGVDSKGHPSTDAEAVAVGALLTFGGHKGSVLAMMIELLGAALIDDFTSAQALAFDPDVIAPPLHGELIIAIAPENFADLHTIQQRAEGLFDAVIAQGARLPSQRRYKARARSERDGAAVPRALYEEILKLELSAPQ